METIAQSDGNRRSNEVATDFTVSRNDRIRENFEAKILNERKQVLEAQKNEELEKKRRLEKLSGIKIKNGAILNSFVQSLEKVSKENFGMLRQAATSNDLALFTKLIVKGSVDMYQNALDQLAKQNIESSNEATKNPDKPAPG